MALCGSQNCGCAIASSSLSVTGSGTAASPWQIELSAAGPTRLPLVFADAAARDAALPLPELGAIAYTADESIYWFWQGSYWEHWSPLDAAQAFTPTWTGLTLGASSNIGTWYRVGGLVTVSAVVSFGAGVAITGNVSMTNLPWTSVGGWAAKAIYTDTSANLGLIGSALAIGTTVGLFRAGTGAAISSTVPFTWISGDILRFDITYPTFPGEWE